MPAIGDSKSTSIDSQELQDGFAANVSPVMFARQANRAPRPPARWRVWGSDVPQPSSFVVRLVAGILGGIGWFCWGYAVLIVVLWLMMVLSVGFSSDDVESGAFAVPGWLFFIGPLALVWAVSFVTTGALWHYLAQRLLIAWHDRK